MKNKIAAVIFLTLICGALGFLLATQYQMLKDSSASLTNQSIPDLTLILEDANEKRRDLTAQKEDISESYRTLKQAYTSESATIEALNNQRISYTAAAGTATLKGSGITITIAAPNHLSNTDLADLVNELWLAGAVAISVNELRIDNQSSFYEKSTKTAPHYYLNDRELTFPLTIKALGEGETVEAALTYPGGIMESLAAAAKVTPTIELQEEVTIPPK